MYVGVPCACLVPTEVRSHPIPGYRSYRRQLRLTWNLCSSVSTLQVLGSRPWLLCLSWGWLWTHHPAQPPANNYDYRWATAGSTASSQTSPLWFLFLRNNYHHLTCNASDLLVYFLLEYKFCSMLVSDLKRMPLYHAQLLFQKWMKTEMNSFSFGLSESTSFAQGWANCTRSSLSSSLTQSRVSILNSQFPLWRLVAFFQSLWMLVFQAGCNPAPVWSWCSLPGNWKVQGRFGSLILIISKSPTTSLIFWRDRSWPDVCNRKGGGQMYIWSRSSKPQAVSFRFKNEHPKFLSRLEFLSLSRWG